MAEEDGKFTQSDVDRIVKERLAREAGKFADYEELKAKVAASEAASAKDKSELEQLTASVSQLTDKLEKSDQRALVLEVATKKKLTPAQARRLQGTTREQLEADADDLLESFKPASDGKGKEGEGEGEGGSEGQQEAGGEGEGSSTQQQSTRRPPDNLTTGGQDAGSGSPDELDPAKLADLIGRR